MRVDKVLVLALVLASVVGPALWAAGGKEGAAGAEASAAGYAADPNLNPPGATPICKNTVTLKIGVAQNPNVVDFEKNDMTLLLEKLGNFDLQFALYASAEMNTQINLVVASGKFGDLPDVILGSPGDAMVLQWGQAGAIIPLNKYYKNSAYHLDIAKKRTGVDYMPMITSPDGNVYGVPTFNQSLGNEYGAKMWIYKPWLDTLGLQVPKTTDDFLSVLTAFKTKDPNKNGKADEIPYLGMPYAIRAHWFASLVNPFQYMSLNNNYYVKSGTVGTFFSTDGYRAALKFVRGMISKGLMPDFQFTIDTNTYNNLASNKEIPIVGCVGWAAATATNRVPDYVGVGPLAAPGFTPNTAFSPSVANVSMMITAGCKTPEAAFRLGDLLVSENMSIMTRWGIQGKHWDYVKDTKADLTKFAAWYEKAGFPGYVIIYEDPWGIVQNFHWYQAGPYIRQYGIAAGRLTPVGQINSEYMISQIQPAYQAVGEASSRALAVPKLIFTKDETSTITEPLASLESYVAESTAAFCVGQRDINNDAEWSAYLKQLDSIGLPKVMAVVQKVYSRMYGAK